MANVLLRDFLAKHCPRCRRAGGRGLVLGVCLDGSRSDQTGSSASKAEEGAGFGGLVEEPTKIINKRLKEKWDENKLTPAGRCDDYTFIRRASLDIIGRIPKVARSSSSAKTRESIRRGLLVDRLLKSPEYQQNWATIWTWWLMTRTGDRLYRDQIHLWLEELFEQDTVSIKDMAEKLITATGKTNDNGAVNYILANLGGSTAGTGRDARSSDALLKKSGQFDMVPVHVADHPPLPRLPDSMHPMPRPSVQRRMEAEELLGRQRLLPPDRAGRRSRQHAQEGHAQLDHDARRTTPTSTPRASSSTKSATAFSCPANPSSWTAARLPKGAKAAATTPAVKSWPST